MITFVAGVLYGSLPSIELGLCLSYPRVCQVRKFQTLDTSEPRPSSDEWGAYSREYKWFEVAPKKTSYKGDPRD